MTENEKVLKPQAELCEPHYSASNSGRTQPDSKIVCGN